MRCFACGGPWHQSSGHIWLRFEIVYCGPCYRHFIAWMKGHMHRKWAGADFYAEAVTSVKAAA